MPAPTHVTVSPRSFACDLATICAPTLAGLKPASLFRYQPASGQDGTAMAVAWHALLAPRGVTVRVLKACPVTGAVLVYVYRPTQVAAILQRGDVQDFLQSEGYTPGDAESMLAQLSQRLCCEEDFPHESACSWATRWQMSSASFRIAAKTLRPAATGRSTPTPPPPKKPLTAIKSASESTPAVITTAPRSGS